MPNLFDNFIYYDSSMADYWENQSIVSGTTLVPYGEALVTGSVAQVHWARTPPSGLVEDLAMWSLYFAVEAGPGAQMSRLDSSDAARVKSALTGAWWTTMSPHISNQWTLKEIQWRHFSADGPRDKNGLVKLSPPWLLDSVNLVGADTLGRLPDQDALTLTYRTSSRKHWGRIYTGGYTSQHLVAGAFGHSSSTLVDKVALAFQVFFKDLYDDARKTWPLVWSPKYRGALTIDELSVDDVWDVVRRRRSKRPNYRKTYTS